MTFLPDRIRPAIVLAAVFAALSGCSTSTTQSFNVVKDSQVEAGYVAVGADFGKYDRLSAADMGIFFPANAAPSAADQQRIRRVFREAFMAELAGYNVVRNETGPSTLLVQASLIDYRNASTAEAQSLSREVRDLAEPGSIVFLMELKDSESGEVLMRAADSTSAPAIATSAGASTDWSAVEAAAARWAGLFRSFLDKQLNQQE